MPCGFDKQGFMNFLEQSFVDLENSFFRGTVENLIDYALTHCHHSLDQACYFLSDMLPEVDFAEVTMFMDDSMLTAHGREVKREILEELKDAPLEPVAIGESECSLSNLDKLVAAAEGMRSSEISAIIDQMDRVFHNDSGPGGFGNGR